MSRPARRTRAEPAPLVKLAAGEAATRLDDVIHGRTRLAIVSALAAREPLSFAELRTALQLTDGNLSVHARRLEDAGYVSCHKSFDGRVPRTEYRLTAAGRRAFERYLEHIEALLEGLAPALIPVPSPGVFPWPHTLSSKVLFASCCAGCPPCCC